MEKQKRKFEVIPHGLCLQCMEAMIDPEHGKPAFYQDLGEGRSLWGVYCEHSRTSAYAFVGWGTALQWTMTHPIDLLDFLAMMDRSAGYYQDERSKRRPDGMPS